MPKPLGQIRKFKRLPDREDVLKHIEAAKAAQAFWESTLALIDRMNPVGGTPPTEPDQAPLPFRETA